MRSLLRFTCAVALAGCASSSSTTAPSAGASDAGDTRLPDAAGDATATSRPDASLDGTTTTRDAGSVVEGGATPLTYMIGIKTNGLANGPAQVEAWLGRSLDVAGTTITTTSYIGKNEPYVTSEGTYPLLEVSFPLISIFGESNDLNDMAKAAAGDYDATYTAMAQHLATWKNPLLSARIGWEFNGTWYKWSKGVGTNATTANFVAAFKRAAAIIKSKDPQVLIQWCIAWGQSDPTPYWPGAYDATTNPGGVDVISMDFYQSNVSQYNTLDGGVSDWALVQSGTGGKGTGPIVLDWMTTFAQTNHVKIALSEYGAGQKTSKGIGSGPGLDDGTWAAASIAWMNSLPAGFFLFANWSDDAPADDIVTAGANPKEQAAWKAAWGSTRYGGTFWQGTPPP